MESPIRKEIIATCDSVSRSSSRTRQFQRKENNRKHHSMGFLRKRSKIHPLRREPIKSSLFLQKQTVFYSRVTRNKRNSCLFILSPNKGRRRAHSPCCRFRRWRSIWKAIRSSRSGVGAPSFATSVRSFHHRNRHRDFFDFAIRYAMRRTRMTKGNRIGDFLFGLSRQTSPIRGSDIP